MDRDMASADSQATLSGKDHIWFSKRLRAIVIYTVVCSYALT